MAAPSLTYTLTNSTTADASQVMQNYNDLLNGITDGTKDLTINALTMNGAFNCKGAVTLGDATADDITVTGSLASTIPVKTNNSFNIGSATLGLAGLYLGNAGVGATCKLVSASHAAARIYTFPDAAAAANVVLSEGAATINGVKTFASGIAFANETMDTYHEGTFTPTISASGTAGTPVYTSGIQVGAYTRIGRVVHFTFWVKWTDWTGSPTGNLQVDLSNMGYTSKNTANLYYECRISAQLIDAPGSSTSNNLSAEMAPNSQILTIVANYDGAGVQVVTASANAGASTRYIIGSGFFFV